MRRNGKSLKESKSNLSEEEGAKAKSALPPRPLSRPRSPLAIAVAYRRQTPEEQRRFEAALDVFLTELVRQHLGPQ